MSSRLKKATITVNKIAQDLFPEDGTKVRRHLDILEELQRGLQDKGDDPTYTRVMFAADGQDKYVELSDRDIHLTGVFPRVGVVRYPYGEGNQHLRARLSLRDRDTLVVVDSDTMAERWETELKKVNYTTRRL